MDYEYTKSSPVKLRDLGFDERWLQDRIEDDISIMGLGDIEIIRRERRQKPGGKIDFLAKNEEEDTRYTIEVMLGKLDANHIIRTIEYWDIERKKYPDIAHRAVIVSEDITNRFFNIISLFNQSVPIIAVQLNATTFENKVFLNFVKILDVADVATEENEDLTDQVDRSHWVKISNDKALGVVDESVKISEKKNDKIRVTYNKSHIALGSSGVNFAWFHPRKSAPHCFIDFRLDSDQRADFIRKLEDAGISAGIRRKMMKVRLNTQEIKDNEELISQILNYCEESSRP